MYQKLSNNRYCSSTAPPRNETEATMDAVLFELSSPPLPNQSNYHLTTRIDSMSLIIDMLHHLYCRIYQYRIEIMASSFLFFSIAIAIYILYHLVVHSL
mmetsp:Transcript_55836/g.63188  ORF Transcript_55836/g.63188 Transcript_55836/m.63188 type:complete len:99 (+) Transcript_55836:34-330(+)